MTKRRQPNKTRKQYVLAELRRAFVVELRVRGNTYRQIAKMVIEQYGADRVPVDYNERDAYMDLITELRRVHEIAAEQLEVVVDLELARLDRMFNVFYDRAVRGDKTAADRALKIMDRRARLLGLDQPVKIAPTDPTGQKEFGSDPRDRLAQLLAAISDRKSEMGDHLPPEQ